MKRILFVVMVALGALPVWGQTPDDDAIRAEVFNPGSQYYYAPLLSRYMKGDTTLTAADYHHLYYGFAMQDQYRPLDPIPAEVDVLTIFDRAGLEMTKEDAEKVVFYGEQVMLRDPFSPTNINFMTYAYGVLGDAEKERISASRMAGVLGVIASSGDGLKENTPWHVIFFSHVNDFLGTKGLAARSRRVVTRSVEYVTLAEPDRKVKGYYFDFGRAYSKPPEVMPEKQKGLHPNL